MAEDITYYAIVDSSHSREHPAGVLRRVRTDAGERDEVFGRHLRWTFSSLLYSAENGSLGNDFIEISEDEANKIVEWVRRVVTEGKA